MVGKRKIFVLILVFMCSFGYPKTKLDSLIDNAKIKSFELKQSKLNYLLALNRVNHKSSLYPASFSFDILSNFTDSMNNIIHYPSDFSYKTSYLQKLPAGVSLGINISYDYTRGVVDFFSDITSFIRLCKKSANALLPSIIARCKILSLSELSNNELVK